MRRKRYLAIIMSLVMVLVLVPETTFAGSAIGNKIQKAEIYLNLGRSTLSSSLELTWSKSSGPVAASYLIYRSDKKNGPYKKISTVSSYIMKYNDKKIIIGKTYYYKVRGVRKENNKNYYTKWSNIQSGCVIQSLEDRVKVEKSISQTFADHLKSAFEEHSKANANQSDFEQLTNQLKSVSVDGNILSDSEITALLSNNQLKDMIKKNEAEYDVDLLFKALKASYGAYWYYGENKFEKAEQNILSWIRSQKYNVLIPDLNNAIVKNLSFIEDAHFFCGGEWNRSVAGRFYHYIYSYDLVFSKDKQGFFTFYKGKKYYFNSFSNPKVSLQKTLLLDGSIVYAPTFYCRYKDSGKSAYVKVKSKDGNTLRVKLSFTSAQPYMNTDELFHFSKKNGFAYIAIGTFWTGLDADTFIEFEQSANQVKDCKAIIFDIRANSGGSDIYPFNWVSNFTGTPPIYNGFYASYMNPIYAARESQPKPSQSSYKIIANQIGKMQKNDIPIIVVVDDQCASSGESCLNYLKTLENVLVVGSNSYGAQLVGNNGTISLPNSGLNVYYGQGFQLHFGKENVDYKGYVPDIWCDPCSSIDSVINLLKKNYSDFTQETADSLFPISRKNPYNVSLSFNNITIGNGQNINYPGLTNTIGRLHVEKDGKVITDYELLSKGTSNYSIKKSNDGNIEIFPNDNATYDINIAIRVNNNTYSYTLHVEEIRDYSVVLGSFDVDIPPYSNFGYDGYKNVPLIIPVSRYGSPLTDYDLTTEKTADYQIEKTTDGKIKITPLRAGYYSLSFNLKLNNKNYPFHAEFRIQEKMSSRAYIRLGAYFMTSSVGTGYDGKKDVPLILPVYYDNEVFGDYKILTENISDYKIEKTEEGYLKITSLIVGWQYINIRLWIENVEYTFHMGFNAAK